LSRPEPATLWYEPDPADARLFWPARSPAGGIVQPGDIAEWRPTDFTESIDLGRPLDNFYYVYKLTEPKRSRAIRRLRKVLDYDKVRDVLGQAVAASANVGMAAAGPVGPLVAPLAGLAGPTARILPDGLMSRLETALADTNMAPWSITHTTLYIPEYPVGPLSMFILVSPAAPSAKLYRIRRDDYDPDRSEMDLGYQEKVRAYQQGRGMMGVTVPPGPPVSLRSVGPGRGQESAGGVDRARGGPRRLPGSSAPRRSREGC